MGQSWSSIFRFALILPASLTAACSGGTSSNGPPITAVIPTPTPPVPPPAFNVDSATLGPNAPVPASSNTTIAGMAVGTVLPLRQSVIVTEVNNVKPSVSAEAGGATLTYQGTQTANSVAGPVFQLKVPFFGIDVPLTGGSNIEFGSISGKVANALNYTMMVTWTATAPDDVFPPQYSMGSTGFQTPSGSVPTSGQATYLGNGTNGAVQGLIFTQEAPYHPPGTIAGSSSSFSVNFASGQVTGSLSNLTATPVSGAPQSWNQINIAATLSGAILSGTTSTPAQPGGSLGFGTGSIGKFDGALYGPSGEELGAVWSLKDPANLNTAFGVVAATKQ